jgi:lysophospholipase L1-like esterase
VTTSSPATERACQALPDEMPRPRATREGLVRLATVVATVTACALVTYTHASFERVRPWVRGEGLPIARLYTAQSEAELPEFQGGLVAANDAAHAAKQRAHTPLAPLSPEPRGSHGPRAGGGVSVDPGEYEGATQVIDNPMALDAFYAALARTAKKEPGAITRISHYGDSAIAADEITFTLRRRLQNRFGDAGHGFMLIAHGAMHYMHRDIAHRESSGWQLSSIVRRELRNGYYGYGGVLARGGGGEHAVFGTVDDSIAGIGKAASSFELFYQKGPGGGDVRLVVDGKQHKTLSTRAPVIEDAWELIEVPDGPHMFSIRTTGSPVNLYGIVQERSVPGVVYDSVGLVGAQADRLLNANPAHMAAQLAHRNPDLLVLGFGGNEAGNEWLDPARYAASLERVITLMRSGKPQVACLLFAPLDQGERNARGDVVTLKVLPAIVAAQREIAHKQGCAYFDTFAAMGGEGSVARWYRKRPRLISSDLRHATPLGYEAVADLYYKALLKGFADYLARR